MRDVIHEQPDITPCRERYCTAGQATLSFFRVWAGTEEPRGWYVYKAAVEGRLRGMDGWTRECERGFWRVAVTWNHALHVSNWDS